MTAGFDDGPTGRTPRRLNVILAAVKSEVVSVRVEPPIKAAFQAAAGREMRSLANMLWSLSHD